jgi:hypothetical protein
LDDSKIDGVHLQGIKEEAAAPVEKISESQEAAVSKRLRYNLHHFI